MKDEDTEEELIFKCKRWLSRDEDDHEICRELPAIRPGEQVLPGKQSVPNKTHSAAVINLTFPANAYRFH